jgi:hypothetical protein
MVADCHMNDSVKLGREERTRGGVRGGEEERYVGVAASR